MATSAHSTSLSLPLIRSDSNLLSTMTTTSEQTNESSTVLTFGTNEKHALLEYSNVTEFGQMTGLRRLSPPRASNTWPSKGDPPIMTTQDQNNKSTVRIVQEAERTMTTKSLLGTCSIRKQQVGFGMQPSIPPKSALRSSQEKGNWGGEGGADSFFVERSREVIDQLPSCINVNPSPTNPLPDPPLTTPISSPLQGPTISNGDIIPLLSSLPPGQVPEPSTQAKHIQVHAGIDTNPDPRPSISQRITSHRHLLTSISANTQSPYESIVSPGQSRPLSSRSYSQASQASSEACINTSSTKTPSKLPPTDEQRALGFILSPPYEASYLERSLYLTPSISRMESKDALLAAGETTKGDLGKGEEGDELATITPRLRSGKATVNPAKSLGMNSAFFTPIRLFSRAEGRAKGSEPSPGRENVPKSFSDLEICQNSLQEMKERVESRLRIKNKSASLKSVFLNPPTLGDARTSNPHLATTATAAATLSLTERPVYGKDEEVCHSFSLDSPVLGSNGPASVQFGGDGEELMPPSKHWRSQSAVSFQSPVRDPRNEVRPGQRRGSMKIKQSTSEHDGSGRRDVVWSRPVRSPPASPTMGAKVRGMFKIFSKVFGTEKQKKRVSLGSMEWREKKKGDKWKRLRLGILTKNEEREENDKAAESIIKVERVRTSRSGVAYEEARETRVEDLDFAFSSNSPRLFHTGLFSAQNHPTNTPQLHTGITPDLEQETKSGDEDSFAEEGKIPAVRSIWSLVGTQGAVVSPLVMSSPDPEGEGNGRHPVSHPNVEHATIGKTLPENEGRATVKALNAQADLGRASGSRSHSTLASMGIAPAVYGIADEEKKGGLGARLL